MNENWGFNFELVIRQQISAENLYPPKESALPLPYGVRLIFSKWLSLVKENLGFKLLLEIRHFDFAGNLYPAKGSALALPIGSKSFSSGLLY